jgi:hypothetical protein
VSERTHGSLLHEVVGKAAVMGEQDRESPQMRQLLDDALMQVVSLLV